ncbi:hypothetical protein [Pseudomonas sp. 22 E 5]|nr:hypothetical protein [Pseudomonas sp. 22 E 5]
MPETRYASLPALTWLATSCRFCPALRVASPPALITLDTCCTWSSMLLTFFELDLECCSLAPAPALRSRVAIRVTSRLASTWLATALMSRPPITCKSRPASTTEPCWAMVVKLERLPMAPLSRLFEAVMLTSPTALTVVSAPLLSTPPTLLTLPPACTAKSPADSMRAALSTKSLRSVR